MMNHRSSISEALELIFRGIDKLKECFPEKAFTIDGRLVGDIGEVLVALEYEVKLYEVQTPAHDGETPDGRKVQVKATFKDKLTMTAVPELYLGLQLSPDGNHREVYNGPGALIAEEFAHRSGIGERQLSFSIAALQQLSQRVPAGQKVARRAL
jgi:hypothetical protein